jgi:hypothetical protein
MQRTRLPAPPEAEPETTGGGPRAQAATTWEEDSLEAGATERLRIRHPVAIQRGAVLVVVAAAVLAALLPAIFPLTPGFSTSDPATAAVAAAVTAAVAIAIIPLADQGARRLRRAGAGNTLVFAAALLSAGAAAIHFAVAKMHFDEYPLFGVFFVASGIAQLVWPLWLLLRSWRPLLLLAALGNALIVALWAVDRIWGLPLGPEHWKPDPVGFADSAASGFEILLVIACITLLVHRPGRPLRRSSGAALTLIVATVTALSLLSVVGVGSSFLTPSQ